MDGLYFVSLVMSDAVGMGVICKSMPLQTMPSGRGRLPKWIMDVCSDKTYIRKLSSLERIC